jgi:Omp85 superfamily domain
VTRSESPSTRTTTSCGTSANPASSRPSNLDRDTTVVTLSKEGRDLLESRRLDADPDARHAFYDGLDKPREATHDTQVYRAYLQEAERLRDEDANVHRIQLDNELKREYQQFLQERNRDKEDSDGRPDRDVEEVRAWALEHHLPCDEDGHLQFPDVRIEYDIDGREHTLDVEVLTPHYRGAHAAAKSSAGFACYRGGAVRLSAGGGGRCGGGRGGRHGGRGAAPMTFDERVQTVVKVGVTERQARFLVTVMLHAGVCVPRQYARFCSIVHGLKTRKFFAKLVRLGYASEHDCRHNRARVYHVHHSGIWRVSVVCFRCRAWHRCRFGRTSHSHCAPRTREAPRAPCTLTMRPISHLNSAGGLVAGWSWRGDTAPRVVPCGSNSPSRQRGRSASTASLRRLTRGPSWTSATACSTQPARGFTRRASNGAPLGSDFDYLRTLIRGSYYQPIGPVVLASNARWGHLQPRGGTPPLTVFDLFFKAGGTQTVRDYKQDELSAYDAFGIPLGGTRLVVFNEEIRFPVFRIVKSVLFAVLARHRFTHAR